MRRSDYGGLIITNKLGMQDLPVAILAFLPKLSIDGRDVLTNMI